MSIEYKDRGALHKLVNLTRFKPHQSKHIWIKAPVKTLLAAETGLLFTKDLLTNRFEKKEFHIKIEHRTGKSGKEKAHIKLVRADIENRPRGLFHKAANLKRFIENDKPKPPKIHGKLFRVAGKTAKLTGKTLLAAETTAFFLKDFAVNPLVGKEFHIRFERRISPSGKIRRYAKIVRTDAPLNRPKGLFHKIYNLNRFVEGDVPFKRNKAEVVPKSKLGKVAYYTTLRPLSKTAKFTLNVTHKTVKTTLLTSETAALKLGGYGINKFREHLNNNTNLDGGRAVLVSITALQTANGARKYLIAYRIRRNRYKNLKQSYKGQKFKLKSAKRTFKAQNKTYKAQVKKLKAVSKLRKPKNTKPFSRVFRQKFRITAEKIINFQHYHHKKVFYKQLIKSDRKKLKQYKAKKKSRIKAAKKIAPKTVKHTSRSRLLQKVRVNIKLNKKIVPLKAAITMSKISLKKNKSAYKAKVKFRSGQIKSAKKIVKKHKKAKIKKAKQIRRKKRIVIKSKVQYEKSVRKIDRKIVKNQKKLKKIAKKELKANRFVPIGAVPLVPAVWGAKKIGSHLYQKALSADPNNDVMNAIDKSAKVTSAITKAANKTLKDFKQTTDTIHKNHLHKQENRLHEKKKNLQKNKKKIIKKNQIKNKSFKDRLAENAKEVLQKAKSIGADFLQFAVKLLVTLLAPLVPIIFAFCIVLMMFTGGTGNSSYILGTYNAQDKDLSRATEEYTKIAYNFNQKILKCSSTSDWKYTLQSLNIDTSSFDNTPNDFKFGRSDKFRYDVADYDFDFDKLAAFMCAYTYPFTDSENDDIENWEWNESYIDVLQQLFDTEYSFECYYEDFSGWKQKSTYNVYGGGGADFGEGAYYTVSSENFSRNRIKTISVPNEINAFCKDGYIHYDYDTLEVLDANNSDKKTGYFIQDQRYFVTDPNGNKTKPFYVSSSVDRSEVEKYMNSDGSFTYHMDGSKYAVLDENGNETGYFITNVSTNPPVFYKFRWKHGKDSDGNTIYENRTGFNWTDTGRQIFYVVGKTDTKKWNDTLENTYLISFYQKYYWYENTTLYYTVKQKCTVDEACKKLLSSKDQYADSRLNFYYILAEHATENGTKAYGNHQMMIAPVGSKSLQSLIDNNQIYNGYGYDIQAWNTTHCGLNECHKGIDISVNINSTVYAMIDGYIDKIDTSNQTISIKTSSPIDIWYDGNDDEKYELEIIYNNISTSLQQGDIVTAGQIIGRTTGKKECFERVSNSSASKNYLHITVKIGDTKVDPRYLIYRNES